MLNIPSEEAVEITETRAPNTLHPITEKIIALLKKDSRITDQQIADELHLKSGGVAHGWRVVTEETLKERTWKD
jgi:DNA-binding Lrp family transcriptional regulator